MSHLNTAYLCGVHDAQMVFEKQALNPITRLALSGGALGGLTGAISSDEGHRLRGALQGAGLGALLGGVGGLAGGTTGAAGSLSRMNAQKVVQNPVSQETTDRLLRAARTGIIAGTGLGGVAGGYIGHADAPPPVRTQFFSPEQRNALQYLVR